MSDSPRTIAAEQSASATGGFTTSTSLLERASTRDAEAWKQVVHIYGPLVDHWCRQASLSPDDCDDVVQDIFLSVSQRLSEFRYDRPQDTFRGWIRVIARRRIADHFRRAVDQPQAVGGTTALQRINASIDPLADDPDAESEEADVSLRALERIRVEFEPNTWTAFYRTVIEAALPMDVAAELGMSAAAVRMAKSRVLSRLRRELAGICSWTAASPPLLEGEARPET